jgi:hypothetical protein
MYHSLQKPGLRECLDSGLLVLCCQQLFVDSETRRWQGPRSPTTPLPNLPQPLSCRSSLVKGIRLPL